MWPLLLAAAAAAAATAAVAPVVSDAKAASLTAPAAAAALAAVAACAASAAAFVGLDRPPLVTCPGKEAPWTSAEVKRSEMTEWVWLAKKRATLPNSAISASISRGGNPAREAAWRAIRSSVMNCSKRLCFAGSVWYGRQCEGSL